MSVVPSTSAGSWSPNWLQGRRFGANPPPRNNKMKDDFMRRLSAPGASVGHQEVDEWHKRALLVYDQAADAIMRTLMPEEMRSLLDTDKPTRSNLHEHAQTMRSIQKDNLERRKLSKFIDALSHYTGVLDVVSQVDFGGSLTLLWGALKFGLVVSKDYHDKLYKITDMMIEIGLVLPRADMYRKTYPTRTILSLVCDLCEAITAFLGQVITSCEQGRFRKYWSAIARPFETKFGDQLRLITKLEKQIEKEAQANQICQTEALSVRRHIRAQSLSRTETVSKLREMPDFEKSTLFFDVRKNLFEGFEIGVNYHEELATIFGLTSSSEWAHWLGIEQQHIPSRFSPRALLVQAECDACDIGTCLQWISQARAEAPHIASAYVVWVRGMTAKAGLASIVLQMLQQRRDVLSEANPDVLKSANTSVSSLWSFFRHLVKKLGGLRVYIAMASIGEEEYALVEKFVTLCESWQERAPINVILIHPYDDGFVKADDCIDSDGTYEVTATLTTTDALYHAVLLCLGIPELVSEAVQAMVWDTLWREVRYAVITISEEQVFQDISSFVVEVADDEYLDQQTSAMWVAGMESWIRKKKTVSTIREQIQRHLDGVDLHMPAQIKIQAELDAKNAIEDAIGTSKVEDFVKRLSNGGSKPLREEHRQKIWSSMRETIQPDARRLYSNSTQRMIRLLLAAYLEDLPDTPRMAQVKIQKAASPIFGWYGTWMKTFHDNDNIVNSIVGAIRVGFPLLIASVEQVTSVSS